VAHVHEHVSCSDLLSRKALEVDVLAVLEAWEAQLAVRMVSSYPTVGSLALEVPEEDMRDLLQHVRLAKRRLVRPSDPRAPFYLG
jgi:hypothetical protein